MASKSFMLTTAGGFSAVANLPEAIAKRQARRLVDGIARPAGGQLEDLPVAVGEHLAGGVDGADRDNAGVSGWPGELGGLVVARSRDNQGPPLRGMADGGVEHGRMGEQHALFRRHPDVVFIDAHLGWLGHDLGRLGKLLDEISTRMRCPFLKVCSVSNSSNATRVRSLAIRKRF